VLASYFYTVRSRICKKFKKLLRSRKPIFRVIRCSVCLRKFLVVKRWFSTQTSLTDFSRQNYIDTVPYRYHLNGCGYVIGGRRERALWIAARADMHDDGLLRILRGSPQVFREVRYFPLTLLALKGQCHRKCALIRLTSMLNRLKLVGGKCFPFCSGSLLQQ
jgi:hypothetical protein